MKCCLSVYSRRVHISATTYELVRGLYEVEEGNGHLRNEYINQQGIKTYLIVGKVKSKAKVCLPNYSKVGYSLFFTIRLFHKCFMLSILWTTLVQKHDHLEKNLFEN